MVGTPALWFAFGPAMLWMVWRMLAHRDWRAGAVLVGIAAGWLSWFVNQERTIFIFYMSPVVPFFVMAVALALGDVLGRARDTVVRRQLGLAAISLYVTLVVLNFGFFYPILPGCRWPTTSGCPGCGSPPGCDPRRLGPPATGW